MLTFTGSVYGKEESLKDLLCMHLQMHDCVPKIDLTFLYFNALVYGSTPWAATGGMDQKLIIWDLQHSSPRCSFDHEVRFHFL